MSPNAPASSHAVVSSDMRGPEYYLMTFDGLKIMNIEANEMFLDEGRFHFFSQDALPYSVSSRLGPECEAVQKAVEWIAKRTTRAWNLRVETEFVGSIQLSLAMNRFIFSFETRADAVLFKLKFGSVG